ncbi:MAG: hypothetical protein LQ347_006016, partial [Umbilicaria vellea]
MINEDFDITYGVELELVFAFRQDLLQGYLDSVSDSSMIIKDLPDGDRDYMANQYFGYSGRPEYMGWGLTTRIAHPLIGYNVWRQIRTYGDEPMQIARDQFPSARIRNVRHWDSHGMELVSPVFTAHPEAFIEISDIVNAISGTNTDPFGALVTDRCGMHIHVGLPPIPGSSYSSNPRFDLATLQHLAYILVMYEAHISTLHPRHRREGSLVASTIVQSNVGAFRLNPPQTVITGQAFNPITKRMENTTQTLHMQPLDQVRRMIWRNGMTPNALANLMGTGKGRIVNWSYLIRLPQEGPRTLEFRQHEGTLDPVAVRWWVLFVTGLVRLAKHMGGVDPHGTGNGYMYNTWDAAMTVWDLFDMMKFDHLDARVHFHQRHSQFAFDTMEGVQFQVPRFQAPDAPDDDAMEGVEHYRERPPGHFAPLPVVGGPPTRAGQ